MQQLQLLLWVTALDGLMDDKSGESQKNRRQKEGKAEFHTTFVCVFMRTRCIHVCVPATHVRLRLEMCTSERGCCLFLAALLHGGHPQLPSHH